MATLGSPLETDPELMSGLGLITARWAALETDLAELLGSLMLVPQAGPEAYYSIGNFTQRIDLVQSLVLASMNSERHSGMALALFDKIRRLWKSRNYLLHSHYVYVTRYADGIVTVKHRQAGFSLRFDKPVKEEGHAYEKRGKNGLPEYVPVNRGTFLNHANQLSKRSRQVNLLRRAIYERITHLKKSAISPSSGKRHPRSRGNLLQDRALRRMTKDE